MKDNFPWRWYFVGIILMVLSAILFEIGYHLQYYELAMRAGMDLSLWGILFLMRCCLYGVTIFLLSVGFYFILDKIYND